MKSQRIRITEAGWGGYTGLFGGVEFEQGLSIEAVDPMAAGRLGSILAIKMVDSDEQAGVAADLVRSYNNKADVVPESQRGVTVAAVKESSLPKYTREFLEAEADKNGIAGLRAIGDVFGVKGRGISELIDAILNAQVA